MYPDADIKKLDMKVGGVSSEMVPTAEGGYQLDWGQLLMKNVLCLTAPTTIHRYTVPTIHRPAIALVFWGWTYFYSTEVCLDVNFFLNKENGVEMLTRSFVLLSNY